MKKGKIIISLPTGTTTEEINQIRSKYPEHKVFIFISGQEDIKENIGNFLHSVLQ